MLQFRDVILIHFEERTCFSLTDRAHIGWFTFTGVAAHTADIIIDFFQAVHLIQGFRIEIGMDFFHIIGIGEAAQGRLLVLRFGVLDHGRIHGFKLESFSGDGLFEVVGSAADPFESSQVCMGVNCFRRCCSPK